jgi:pimeloyl-ACP methyl ester carboxylesterase
MLTKDELDFIEKRPWSERCEATTTEWKYRLTGGTLSIAFRGSTAEKGSKDWGQNFTIPLWPARAFKDMPVLWFSHLGFHRKWQSVQRDVFGVINRYRPEKIVLLGFSQGGAVAVRAFEDIAVNLERYVPGVNLFGVTTGAPAAVWFWNLHKIKNRWRGLTQYQDVNDIVPRSTLPFGYRHVGRIVKLGKRRFIWPWNLGDVHNGYGRYCEEAPGVPAAE